MIQVQGRIGKQGAPAGRPDRRAARWMVLGVLAAISACDTPTPPPEMMEACEGTVPPLRMIEELPRVLHDSLLWYRGTAYQSFDDYPQDDQGVIVFSYDGAWHYNPVQMAQRALWFTDNYRRSGDTRYLERAEAHASRLLRESVLIDGARLFPYTFPFRLHDRGDQVMDPPWYSGMGQGQVLSLLLRLNELTADSAYMRAAVEVMASFHRLAGEAEPFVARVDCDGYYWIEEYPMPVSTRTLNGFVFGFYGVYEYWRRTGDEGAGRLVRAALATLEHYLPQYRVPGEISYYCLKHRAQYTYYHHVHWEQTLYLHRMTRDPFFAEFMELLAADAPT